MEKMEATVLERDDDNDDCSDADNEDCSDYDSNDNGGLIMVNLIIVTLLSFECNGDDEGGHGNDVMMIW